MKNFFLTLSGLIFGVVAALHLVRLLAKWSVRIGPYAIPTHVSLWACLAAMLLSLGCFAARAAKK